MTEQTVLIIGGSITGLTAALALKEKGFQVTIVDRDPSPDASIGWADSNRWVRRGAAHTLQPHVLTARLRNALWQWYPDLVQAMLDAGVWEMDFADTVHPVARKDYRPRPGDEDITILVSRRTTLELVMRRYVADHSIATFLDGVQVTSLIIEGEPAPLRVRGVHTKGKAGEGAILADVVIDASGRTTKFADQLRARGAAVQEEHHASHSVYYTRHYLLLPGEAYPGLYGLPAASFADMTVAAFPGDNGAFVVTIGAFRDDPLLFETLQDADLFDTVCRGVPRVATWIDPQRSRPTSGVMGWASMDFLWRSLIADGAPQVLGFFLAGDTALRSNPKYGRGCTCGTIGARMLADTLAASSDEAERLALYEAALHGAFRKEWEELLAVDETDYARFRAAAGLSRESWTDALRSRLRDHIMNRAMLCDPAVQREIMRGFYGLTNPSDWTRDLGVWARIARALIPPKSKADVAKQYFIRPSRDEIKSWVEAARTAA
jgi:2-polyprenyl-6-methoxyphenol hydroxylase-like FAD-dependent oxidoreductase